MDFRDGHVFVIAQPTGEGYTEKHLPAQTSVYARWRSTHSRRPVLGHSTPNKKNTHLHSSRATLIWTSPTKVNTNKKKADAHLKPVGSQEHVDAGKGLHKLAGMSVVVMHHLLHDPATAQPLL